MAKPKLNSEPVFQAFSYTAVSLLSLLCLLPFIVLISGSVSREGQVLAKGYSLLPRGFSLDAYAFIFRNPAAVLSGYRVSVIVAVAGTVLSLLISSMAAYVMYRKEVKYRNQLAFFLFFTTLFNGGLAPYFIWITSYLHLKNSLTVLILLPMFNVMYVLILRSFIQDSVPEPLVESARLDGAGDFRIFWQLVLPLCKPVLASIGLFTVLAYWNDWWTPMMFTDKERYVPLQYLLYKMLSSMNLPAAMAQHASTADAPKETFKLAMTVVATGPVVILFPFLQQYFVKGITLGAVKG